MTAAEAKQRAEDLLSAIAAHERGEAVECIDTTDQDGKWECIPYPEWHQDFHYRPRADRPWSCPAEVPPGTVWLRKTGLINRDGGTGLVCAIEPKGVIGVGMSVTFETKTKLLRWADLINCEWSPDRSPGSWKPCTTEGGK